MNKAMVKCETDEGMFSNEKAVTLQSDGGKVSLFADNDLITERKGVSYLRVTNLSAKGTERLTRVLLPSEAFEKGTRWIDVSSDLVEENI